MFSMELPRSWYPAVGGTALGVTAAETQRRHLLAHIAKRQNRQNTPLFDLTGATATLRPAFPGRAGLTIRPWDESTEYPTKYHPSGIGSLGLYIVTPLKGYILVSRVTSCVATHL